MSRIRYIVELEPGCWRAPWSGDPGRTMQIESAAVYPSRDSARIALVAARKYRRLRLARVVPVEIKITEVSE